MGLVICNGKGKKSPRESLIEDIPANSRIYNVKPTLDKAKESKEIPGWMRMKFLEPADALARSLSTDRSNVSPRVGWDGKRKLQDPGMSLLRSLSTDLNAAWERATTGGSLQSCTKTDSYKTYPMTRVHSNLWIGNEENSNDKDQLTSKGITHVLSLTGNQSSVCYIQRKLKPMDDRGRSDIKDVLEEVFEFMEGGLRGNNNLLVHCQSGQNRSAVIVIAFLMKKFNIKLDRAYTDLEEIRPLVQVNVDYGQQLLDLELDCFGSNSLPSDFFVRKYQKLILKLKDISSS